MIRPEELDRAIASMAQGLARRTLSRSGVLGVLGRAAAVAVAASAASGRAAPVRAFEYCSDCVVECRREPHGDCQENYECPSGYSRPVTVYLGYMTCEITCNDCWARSCEECGATYESGECC